MGSIVAVVLIEATVPTEEIVEHLDIYMAIGEGAGIAVSVEPCAVGAVRAVVPLLAIGGEGHNGEFRRVELRLANTNEL